MSKYFSQARSFVVESFSNQGKEYQIKHFDRTVHWLKVLKPDSDEAMLVAAIAHDIERGHRKPDMLEIYGNVKFDDEKFIGPHQRRGADIIGEFLESLGADAAFVKRVKHLVSKHEVGGDADQDLLKDADSISFFECNAGRFITHKAKKVGVDIVKAKFDFMYNRISTDKARRIAKPLYEKSVDSLSKLEN